MDLLEDLEMSLLNFNFVMIYMIHEMLVFLKNDLNYLNDSSFEYLFEERNRLLFFFKKRICFIIYDNGNFMS